MTPFRKLACAACAALALMLPFATHAQGKLEKPKVGIAVGGKSGFYYLPLTIAERLNYFKEEGLDVEISDFGGGHRCHDHRSDRCDFQRRSGDDHARDE